LSLFYSTTGDLIDGGSHLTEAEAVVNYELGVKHLATAIDGNQTRVIMALGNHDVGSKYTPQQRTIIHVDFEYQFQYAVNSLNYG
jgi:hypothetical protein